MRSGYTYECDGTDHAMWRGRVASAMRGKRGQALLRDCLAALDAMPVKRLIPENLVDGGDVCLLGAVGKHRAVADIDKLDPEDHETIGARLNVAPCLVMEIEYENDEAGPYGRPETPEERFARVRKWVAASIAEAKGAGEEKQV
jgi:hypothetical protein